MADLWLYNPDYCDGEPCAFDCDNCPVAEKMLEDEENEDCKNCPR